MPLKDLSDPDAVRMAVREFDEKGSAAFLNEHGFKDAKHFYLVVDGKHYPSKAIAAVAYNYQFPDRLPLKEEPAAYSGGDETVVPKLRSLGFEVIDTRTDAGGSKAWIFQGNPEKYDIRAATRALDIDDWSVPQFNNDIHVGDRVYMWESGPQGGVVATGEVISEPEIKPHQPNVFVRDPSATYLEDHPRCDLRIQSIIEPPLRRDEIKGNPRLQSLSILRFSQGTNFRVTSDERVELDQLLASRMTSKISGSGDALPKSLRDVFHQVLALQPSWASTNTPEMERRGILVRRAGPQILRTFFPESGSPPNDLETEGRDGTGRKTRIPWMRVYSRTLAPGATAGWYLVYLFSGDGSSVSLSLNQGSTFMEGGQYKTRPESFIQERVEWALDVLGERVREDARYKRAVDLKDEHLLAKAYELSHVVGIEYPAEAIPADVVLRADILQMLPLLMTLYEREGATPPEEPVATKPLHLILKWRSTSEPATVTKHKEIADAKGSVWWGAFGKREGNWSSPKRFEALRSQFASQLPTYAFLYGGGQEWRARILAVEQDPTRLDMDRFPAYYRVEDCRFFVELTEFAQLSPGWVASHLVLARSPDPERMPGALANQTNPLFVVQLEEASVETPSARTFDWLEEETLWPLDQLEGLVEALQNLDGRQIILAGPPGTGKTWVAKKLAEYATRGQSAAYRVVQFHPSYSYEDFIEGLRPTVTDGGINFTRVDGIVLEMVREIETETQLHIIVVDEMNRANLPRVLGELMYLFEYRGESIDLRYTRGFELPKNLRFIGTMNTADRSIRSIDVALRRRFDIFECEPSADILSSFYKTRVNQVEGLIEGFIGLNERLRELLDRHHTIGHTFFMAHPMTTKRLRYAWQRQISPLIEEYFFDQPDIAASFDPATLWPSFNA